MPRQPDLPCASCGKLMWRGRGVLPAGQARCRACRSAEVVCGTLASYDKRGCRCDACKAANAAARRAHTASFRERNGAAYRAPSRARTNVEFRCVDCGCEVAQRRTDEPRCVACWRSLYYARKRARVRRRKAIERLARAAAGVPASASRTFVHGVCARCGETFTRRGHASAYCSKRCSGRASKWIAKPARVAIYERDNWTCQLCFGSIEPTLHYLDNWAASLDHIECQSWALIPDDSPKNLRTAHRWCNSVRGNESYYTEADLRTETRHVAV